MLSHVRSREARPSSRTWLVLKTLGQTAVFWSVFLFLLPAAIHAAEGATSLRRWRFDGPGWDGAGVALFVLGGALGLTSGVVMAVCGRGTPLPTDCARELVVVGPYRHLRNPMAVAGLAQGVGVGLLLGSPAVLAYALLGGPVWHGWIRPWEEADLERRFGEPYRRYRAAVRCWVPCFPGYRPADGSPRGSPAPVAAALGDPDLTVAGLRLWVHGREFPASEDRDDGNWLVVTACCRAAGAPVGVRGAILMVGDVAAFGDRCAAMSRGAVASAALSPVEPQLGVSLEAAEGLGHVRVQVELTPDPRRPAQRFEFGIDRSELPGIVRQCAAIVRAYPIRGR